MYKRQLYQELSTLYPKLWIVSESCYHTISRILYSFEMLKTKQNGLYNKTAVEQDQSILSLSRYSIHNNSQQFTIISITISITESKIFKFDILLFIHTLYLLLS